MNQGRQLDLLIHLFSLFPGKIITAIVPLTAIIFTYIEYVKFYMVILNIDIIK